MRTETEVRIDPDGTVDVIHAYHAQDVQDALYGAGLLKRPDVTSLRARAKVAIYTSERFQLQTGAESVVLSILGAEIEGSTLYVYQTAKLTDASVSLRLNATMLRELVVGQVNSVNIIRDNETMTVDFQGDEGWKAVA